MAIQANKRQWGYVVRTNPKTGKTTEINLYLYEKVELARFNIAACKQANADTNSL